MPIKKKRGTILLQIVMTIEQYNLSFVNIGLYPTVSFGSTEGSFIHQRLPWNRERQFSSVSLSFWSPQTPPPTPLEQRGRCCRMGALGKGEPKKNTPHSPFHSQKSPLSEEPSINGMAIYSCVIYLHNFLKVPPLFDSQEAQPCKIPSILGDLV